MGYGNEPTDKYVVLKNHKEGYWRVYNTTKDRFASSTKYISKSEAKAAIKSLRGK